MEPPIAGMTVTPEYCHDPLTTGVWVGFLKWAVGHAEIRDEFKAETGHDLDSLVSGSPLDQMMDEACGRPRAMFVAFADWVTLRHWNGQPESE